jgi:hypothetical protein
MMWFHPSPHHHQHAAVLLFLLFAHQRRLQITLGFAIVKLHPYSSSNSMAASHHRHRFRETYHVSILVGEDSTTPPTSPRITTRQYSTITDNDPTPSSSALPPSKSLIFSTNVDTITKNNNNHNNNIVINEFEPPLSASSSSSVISTNSANSVILPTPSPMPGDCDMSSYIHDHATSYHGDASFLTKGPTPRTQRALSKFQQLLADERAAGGVLSVDTNTPSTITSHAPGYLLSKDEDIIVGMQSDMPLKRTCKPHGGYGVVKAALEAYGYEPGDKIKAFKDDVVTHNDLTFSMYTSKVRSENCNAIGY